MKKCYLTLNGGGTFGAFHSGLAIAMQEKGYEPTKISSTSIGSIVGIGIKIGKIEEVKKVFLGLHSLFDIVNGGELFGLPFSLFKGGVFSSNKLEEIITDVCTESDYNNSVDIEQLVTAVNLQTGNLEIFSSRENNYREFIKAILASAAIPTFFKPVRIRNNHYVDGATREAAPVAAVYEVGGGETSMDHIISICSPFDLKRMDRENFSIIDVFGRSLAIQMDEVQKNDLRIGKAFHWGNNIRFVQAENNSTIMNGVFDFRSNAIKELINYGYKQGIEKL